MFSSTFRDVADRNALLKQKATHGDNAPFMAKQLNKAILDRSRIKNRYSNWHSRKKNLKLKKRLTPPSESN